MTRLLPLLLGLLVVPALAAAAPLCADRRPAELLPMREADFDLYRAERNLELLASLTEPFGQAIAKANDRQAADPGQLPTVSTFLSSYPNALNQIHGTLLKQRALVAEQELEIAKLHRRSREVRAAQANFANSQREFCQFLEVATFID